jgi:hypothetical protein
MLDTFGAEMISPKKAPSGALAKPNIPKLKLSVGGMTK